MTKQLKQAIRNYFRKKRSPSADILNEEPIPVNVITGYTSVISQHIQYFNRLSDSEKLRFLTRVYNFRNAKKFHYLDMVEIPEIPILVSAAAVQLTFGLSKYKLSYFRDIYITPDAYLIPDFSEKIVGHVSPKGIHLSWKHFLTGYNNESDNVNVAIHEMAHALEFENFLSGVGIDWEFRNDLEKFYTIAGPMFAKVLSGKPTYLRYYAYSNMREFWAVTTEAFFENPIAFSLYMPDLYKVMCNVLNQDPAE